MSEATFRMNDKMITVIKGDTMKFGIQPVDEVGNPYTGKIDKIMLAVEDFNNKKIIEKEAVYTSSLEIYNIKLSAEETESLGTGYSLFKVRAYIGEDVVTVMHGILEVE